MAHKTFVNGTAYEVSGGRTLVNGTGYKIDKGRTLVNGTGYDISFFPSIGTPLNNMTWAEVRAVSDAGLAASYFSVGDRKAVTLNGTVGSCTFSNQTYYCYIIGIDHNSSKEGANRIHFQFGYTALSGGVQIAFVDSGYNKVQSSGSWFNMNNTNSNAGGWSSSRMRTVTCPAFKSVMPYDLQTVLKVITKYSDNIGGGNLNYIDAITATSDEIFLLAEYEVSETFDESNRAEHNSQVRYAYYSAGNPRLRYKHNETNTSAGWFLRSPHRANKNAFVYIAYDNDMTGAGAYSSYGFAPAFCV